VLPQKTRRIPPVEAYQEFGLPFRFWDVPGTSSVPTYGSLTTCPSDIVGTQALEGTAATADQVIRQDNGRYAYRNGTTHNWAGLLETGCLMEPAAAYWYKNMRGYDMDLILAGDAEIDVNDIPERSVDEPGSTAPEDYTYVPYSWRDARELAVGDLGLIEQGFLGGANAAESDRVLQQGLSGFYAWNKTSGTPPLGWKGLMTTEVPGEGYWISNQHVGSNWAYTFAAPPALGQAPTSKPASAAIAKFKHSLVKKASVKAHTTDK